MNIDDKTKLTIVDVIMSILLFITFLLSVKPLDCFFTSSNLSIETFVIVICNLFYMSCGLHYIMKYLINLKTAYQRGIE